MTEAHIKKLVIVMVEQKQLDQIVSEKILKNILEILKQKKKLELEH